MYYFVLKTDKEIMRFLKTDFAGGETLEEDLKQHIHLTETHTTYNWMQLILWVAVFFVVIRWMKTDHEVYGFALLIAAFWLSDFLFKRKWLS